MDLYRFVLCFAVLLCISIFSACRENTKDDASADAIINDLPGIEHSIKIENYDYQRAAESAMILTDHLVNFVMTKDWLSEGYVFTYDDVDRFLTSLCLYKDELSHPYSDKISLSEDEMNFIISKESVCNIAAELFNIDHIDLDSLSGYDKNTMQYIIPVGVGLRNTKFTCDYLSHYFENDSICVKIKVIGKDMYENFDNTDYGEYILRFKCINADLNGYLQIVSISHIDDKNE